MTELEQLSKEVSNCTKIGQSRRQRRYSQQLRAKLTSAAVKYGYREVAQATGISVSTIWMWLPKTKKSITKKQKEPTNIRPIIIKELPRMSAISSQESFTRVSTLKLTSAAGICLEVSTCSSQDMLSIVNAFIGGAR